MIEFSSIALFAFEYLPILLKFQLVSELQQNFNEKPIDKILLRFNTGYNAQNPFNVESYILYNFVVKYYSFNLHLQIITF